MPSSSALIASGGYLSVVVLMAIQSACIPIPSEVIMPLAGYALAHTQLQLILLATVASLASNLGSIPAYWVGARGGRPMVERYGSYLLLSRRDLDLVDHFFARFGSITVLIGRMLPIVRTFIAFPAGVAKMNQWQLPHLHLHRLLALVLRARLHRHEARRFLEHQPPLQRDLPPLPPRRRSRHRPRLHLVLVSHWKNRIRTEPA